MLRPSDWYVCTRVVDVLGLTGTAHHTRCKACLASPLPNLSPLGTKPTPARSPHPCCLAAALLPIAGSLQWTHAGLGAKCVAGPFESDVTCNVCEVMHLHTISA